MSSVNRLKPLKWYRNLNTRKGRYESGFFLIEGIRSIRQVMAVHPHAVKEIIYTSGAKPLEGSCPIRIVTEAQFKSISTGKTPQGIAAILPLPENWNSVQLPGKIGTRVLLLEHIQDPGNVGTLIRTAAAFGFSGVILSDQCADPFSPKCVQASTGTILSMWIRRTSSYLQMAETLQSQKYELIAMDMKGSKDIQEFIPSKTLVLALGNEGSGLSSNLKSMANQSVRIPMDDDNAESLNVAVCGGIGMYYFASEK